jgi:hypothetical protein
MKQDELVTFIKTLQAHRGELTRIKTQIFWYNDVGWEETPGRVCLILDVLERGPQWGPVIAATAADGCSASSWNVAESEELVLLLIDELPKWVWLSEDDIEFIGGHSLSNLGRSVLAHDIS